MSADARERAPPPFTLVSFHRAGDGSMGVSGAAQSLEALLGVTLDAVIETPTDSLLAAAVDGALRRVERDGGTVSEQFYLEDPSGRGRLLHCHLEGLRDSGGRAQVIAVLHDLSATTPSPRRSPALRSAIIRVDLESSGEIVFHLVDEGIRQLTTLNAARFARSRQGRAIAGRARKLYALDAWSPDLPLNDLTVEAFEAGAPPLQCRFFRSPESSRVGVVLHDLPPVAAPETPAPGAVDDLLRLLRVAAVLLENPPLQRGLAELATVIAETPLTRSVAIALIESGRLRTRATAGLGLPLAVGVAERALTSRRTVHELADGHDPAVCAVPIEAGDAVLGVIELRFVGMFTLGPWQSEVLGSFADYVAALVTHSPARPRALRRQAQLRDELDLGQMLTPRQQQVLFAFVDTGYANRELGEALKLAEGTVKVHMRAIMHRLGVDSRSEALHMVYRRAPRWLAEMRRRYRPDVPPNSTG